MLICPNCNRHYEETRDTVQIINGTSHCISCKVELVVEHRTALNCKAKFYCIDREDMNCKYYEEGEKYQCKHSYGEFCQSGRANLEAMKIAQQQRILIK